MTEAAQLRRLIRRWQRGRASLSWRDLAGDAYVAALAAVMVGAMGVNVVLGLRGMGDAACVGTCGVLRPLLPWLCVPAVAALALGLARLLGPISCSPAVSSWLLGAPVDRGELLRPVWRRLVLAAAVGPVLLLAAPALLGGLGVTGVLTLAMASSAVGLVGVTAAACSQVREHRLAQWLTWAVVGTVVVLGALVAGGALTRVPSVPTCVGVALAVLALAVAAALAWRVRQLLALVPERVLRGADRLPAALSGALGALDLGLLYDVLLARRWGRGARVRSLTGGPGGWWALVHRDLLRARRTPQPLVLLAGLAVLPYLAAQLGAGRAVVLVTVVAGVVVGPALCAGLRVVVRTEGLARMLPFSRQAVLAAHALVPAGALLAYGLVSSGALVGTMPTAEAVVVGAASGFSALAASIRWVVARPPDYDQPMVSTPAGAVPPGVVASVVRGFDVAALTAFPLVLGGLGIVLSAALSLAVIWWVLGRPRR